MTTPENERETGGGIENPDLSEIERERSDEVRSQATPEERLQGMADLANDLTNERAMADGLLTGRADINAGREIEERYGALREAMMNDLAEDEADVLARFEPAEPPEQFRSHSVREAATEQLLTRALHESGASEEEIEGMFRRPAHLPTAEREEEMRQATIERAAEINERALDCTSDVAASQGGQ